MLGLYCYKTYGAMINYDDGNDYGNNNDNTTSGSGSDGSIFDPITMPWYCIEGSGNDGDGAPAAAHYTSTRHTIYLSYKDPIEDVP